MIKDKDRTGYIGASDTKYVMMGWDTKTFQAWWQSKIGMDDGEVDNIYTLTGNLYEPLILDFLNVEERNRQIIIGRLRVNLDGETEDKVIEVKTYNYIRGWKKPKNVKKWDYWMQVQVEMFATNKRQGMIAAYGLLPTEYGEECEIDPNRMLFELIEYDEAWIEDEYLPRLNILAKCIEDGEVPSEQLRKENMNEV